VHCATSRHVALHEERVGDHGLDSSGKAISPSLVQTAHKEESWVEVLLHCGEGHVHVAIAQLGKLRMVRLWDVYKTLRK
jgi:hypothetical protein